MTLIELQGAITRAVVRARSLGYSIAAGAFVDFDPSALDAPDSKAQRWCCPLGAVALSAGLRARAGESEGSAFAVATAAAALGVCSDWVWSFADGFDAIDLTYRADRGGGPRMAPYREGHAPVQEAFDLGRWWRDRIDHPELGLPGEAFVEFPGEQLELFIAAPEGAS